MKRIFCVVLSVVIVLGAWSMALASNALLIASNPVAVNFSDVDRSTPQGQAIYKLAEAGILLGNGDGSFRPYDPITRAELCKIVNAIFGYTEPAESGFSDMTGDEWFYPYVLVAKKAGYIIGYDDGTFRADDYVSREQACVILCRVAGLYDLGLNFTITDPVAEWAMPYVQMVLGNGLMALEEGNTFRATYNINRSEFSTVYANFYIPKVPEQPQPPVVIGGGGSSGGSSGGGSGGGSNGGSDSKPNYSQINKETVTKLNTVLTDIEAHESDFRGTGKEIFLTVKDCVQKAINKADQVEINGDFIQTEYASQIKQIESLCEGLKQDEAAWIQFENAALGLKTETLKYLVYDFGLEKYISEYI